MKGNLILQYFLAVSLISLGTFNASQAATVTTEIQFGGIGGAGCTIVGSGSSSSTGTCSWAADTRLSTTSAAARSDFGSLGVGIVSSSSAGSQAQGETTADGSAFARFEDSITIDNGPSSGVLRLAWNLEGFGLHFESIANTVAVVSSIGVTLIVSNGQSNNLVFGAHSSGTDLEISSNGNYFNTIRYVDLQFTNNSLPIIATLSAGFSCELTQFAGASCSMVADFMNSAKIMGAMVFDAEMNLVQNPVLVSASGFNYLNPAPVPIPAPFALLCSALAAIGLYGFKNGRKQGSYS